MGWFCTTSFGGDAFQMGNMESFFTLLLSPLHLALSLTAWWSLFLSLSLFHSGSLFLSATTHTHTHKFDICDKIHSGKDIHMYIWTHLKNVHTHTVHTRTACGVLHMSTRFCTNCIETLLAQRVQTYRHTPHHLNIHSNPDNTHLGDSLQLGLSGALLLFCTDSSFHWVHRDKAASSFFYYTHLQPLDCEKSFNAVPLREEKNSLKKVHSLANSHRVTFQSQCEWPLKEQCSYLNKSPFCYFLAAWPPPPSLLRVLFWTHDVWRFEKTKQDSVYKSSILPTP